MSKNSFSQQDLIPNLEIINEQQNLPKDPKSNSKNSNNNLPDNEHAALISRENSQVDLEEAAREHHEDYQMLLNNSQGSIYDPNVPKPNDPLEVEQQQSQAHPQSQWQKIIGQFRNHLQKYRERREQKKQEFLKLSQKSNVSLLVRLSVQSTLAWLLWRQRQTFIERRKLAQRDLLLAEKMKSELEVDGFCYLNQASEGQQLIIKGRIDTRQKSNILKSRLWTFVVSDNKSSRQTAIQTDKDQFQDSSPVMPLQSSKNVLTSAIASTAYFLSSNLLKFKLKTDNKLSLSNTFYFLGIKTQTQDLLKATNIMKSIDILRHQVDKRIMIACGIGCTIASVILMVKAVKSVHALARRNKDSIEKTTNVILSHI